MIEDSVARRFDVGSPAYDENAGVQKRVVDDFFRFVGPSIAGARKVVDLGCGTGDLLSLCYQSAKTADLVGVDVSEGMLNAMVARGVPAKTVLASMEGSGLEGAEYDWVLSTSALQWANVDSAVAEMVRLCADEATIAISWFTEQTLGSWRRLWGGSFFRMPSQEEVGDALLRHGFRIVKRESKFYVDEKQTFNQAVMSVNGVGAGMSSSTHRRISKSEYLSAKRCFEEVVSEKGGFAMEYPTEFLLAKKI